MTRRKIGLYIAHYFRSSCKFIAPYSCRREEEERKREEEERRKLEEEERKKEEEERRKQEETKYV